MKLAKRAAPEGCPTSGGRINLFRALEQMKSDMDLHTPADLSPAGRLRRARAWRTVRQGGEFPAAAGAVFFDDLLSDC